jgi:hypothetical protein
MNVNAQPRVRVAPLGRPRADRPHHGKDGVPDFQAIFRLANGVAILLRIETKTPGKKLGPPEVK